MSKREYKGEYLIYTLTEINKGVVIEFTKNTKIYEVNVEQVELGHTSLTDYYKYGDSLTYNEFRELEKLISKVEDAVIKWKVNWI